ncbi:hypothetical protein CHS0354_031025 [Potamilus streckersoni]|uniref:Speriolin C-terminal domain-containing protein n=1 Tax=Potamilus streckersoni TaxID=2493646 RepID=A0AAE0WBG0_9BIVA|nr:hypothetical protein CHS0354_031025 [Potamilus streckersoni]
MDACSTHSLEQLLGLKGEDANKRAKSILFRPVDKICGQHPIITRSLKHSLSTMKPNMRLVGEIAFQLDRRILDHVFTEARSLQKKSKSSHRFYGFSISTIYQMMHKIAKKGNRFDNNMELEMRLKFEKMLVKLSSFGYIYDLHADFTQDIVNKYGLLNGPPDQLTIKGFGLDNPLVLRVLLAQLIRDRQELYDMLIILDCLCFLSYEDGKPLFIW